MASWTKRLLSGSTDGTPIAVTAVASPGTTIHTTSTATSTFDSIYIDAFNTSTVYMAVTIEWGSTSTSARVVSTVPPNAGIHRIVDGWLLQGGAIVRALSTATGRINVSGWVNRLA